MVRHTHTHTHTNTHTHTHTHTHTRKHTETHAHTHKYAHTHTHTHARPHTHTHTHTHTHRSEFRYGGRSAFQCDFFNLVQINQTIVRTVHIFSSCPEQDGESSGRVKSVHYKLVSYSAELVTRPDKVKKIARTRFQLVRTNF